MILNFVLAVWFGCIAISIASFKMNLVYLALPSYPLLSDLGKLLEVALQKFFLGVRAPL